METMSSGAVSKSSLVRETIRMLKNSEYIVSQQKRDPALKLKFLGSGTRNDDFLTDDQGVLWHAPRGH